MLDYYDYELYLNTIEDHFTLPATDHISGA